MSAFEVFKRSELAAEMYVDGLIDGQGLSLAAPLTFPGEADRVDIPISVSAIDFNFGDAKCLHQRSQLRWDSFLIVRAIALLVTFVRRRLPNGS